jgi:hypothetical protein
MTIIGETTAEEDWFNITLPSDLIYFDFSCAIYDPYDHKGSTIYLNGASIQSADNSSAWGRISAAQLPTDQQHEFSIGGTGGRFAIIIIYREP